MKLIILGTGGFATELAWHLEDSTIQGMHLKELEEVLFVSKSESLKSEIGGYEVISEAEICNRVHPNQTLFGVAIGDLDTRKKVTFSLLKAGFKSAQIVSNFARISKTSFIGSGSIICPGVTIMPNVVVGAYFQAHLNSYVAHDTKVGDFVTFLPASICSGNVSIGNEALIGAGAIIKEGSRETPLMIGNNSVVGMGSVVLKHVLDSQIVVGNPARPLRIK